MKFQLETSHRKLIELSSKLAYTFISRIFNFEQKKNFQHFLPHAKYLIFLGNLKFLSINNKFTSENY